MGSCSNSVAKKNGQKDDSPYTDAVTVGSLEDAEITESSGIAASKCQTGVYWTHNDSGDDAFIFAIGPKGEKLGTWRVPSATNYDWEDIASTRDSNGKCHIYIGDIGDNGAKRDYYIIYKVEEPLITPTAKQSSKHYSNNTQNPESIRFTYPDGKHNAETLLVDPKTGNIYIVTKRFSGPARVFKLIKGTSVAEKLGEIALPAVPNGSVTGGDISPNGDRLVLCDYSAIYEFKLVGGVTADNFFTATPVTQTVGDRNIGESVAYAADGNSLFLTSEGSKSAVLQLTRKK
ncbi:MAG TPA: hypothetical protein PKA82_00365 [Pyrinomonadaceae bacterium]|nr:hypothetical protein [Pyrinomonadaceae bacterium]